MTKLNIKLLKKVRNRIAKIPESYDQSAWFLESNDKAPCGTVGCLAGEIVICAAPSIKKGIDQFLDNADDVIARAEDLLGLEGKDHSLWAADASGWPEPFALQFKQANRNKKKEAQVAVAYLDECIKRGKVTW